MSVLLNLQKVMRSARTTAIQYMLMADAMVSEPLFAANRSVGKHGKENLAAFWRNLANTLNNAGPSKTIIQWQKVWTTLKSNVRTKVSNMRRDRLQTGNTSTRTTLSELEEKVLSLMGGAAVAGLGVPDNLHNDDRSLLALMDVAVGDEPAVAVEMQQEDEVIIEELWIPSGSGGVWGEFLKPVVSPSPPTTPHTMDRPPPPHPQPSTQRLRRRPRLTTDQNENRAAFQKLMEQQNCTLSNIAEAQKRQANLIKKNLIEKKRERDRKERVRERERDREERKRDREEREKDREERVRERERDREEREKDREEREKDREERERDREERAEQFAQLMLILSRLGEKEEKT